jgi:hypothetical protein
MKFEMQSEVAEAQTEAMAGRMSLYTTASGDAAGSRLSTRLNVYHHGYEPTKFAMAFAIAPWYSTPTPSRSTFFTT